MDRMEPVIRSLEPWQEPWLPASVACPGVECSYTHQACKAVFERPDIRFYEQFGDVFQAVAQGERTYGVVPIENTLAGSVTDNYDLLLKYGLYITGTVKIKISHCLLGTASSQPEQITDIYSHEQAIHQCSDYFREHRDQASHPFSNTAASAKYVAELDNPHFAAIGSLDCAEKYGLKILSQDIQNRKDNFTRFVVVARQPILHPACSRISLIIRVAHKAGSLYGALSRFAEKGINLLKLESRPIPDSPFEFLFYWDFSGNMEDQTVKEVITDLQQDIIFMKYLGNYPEL